MSLHPKTLSEAIERQKLAAERQAKRAEKRAILGTDTKNGANPPQIAELEAARGYRTGVRKAKKAKGKKKRLPTIKKLKKSLWAAMTEYVRIRDGAVCRVCNFNEGYALFHLVPSNEGAWAKWTPENTVWGCSPCNADEYYHRARWARKLEQLFGKDRMDALWENAKNTLQLRRPDLEARISDLQGRTAALKMAASGGEQA